MVKLILLGFVCASVNTIAEAAFSNCPKVSIMVPSDVPLHSRNCYGSLVRASTRTNNIPAIPDCRGKKRYSSKTGFFLYAHFVSPGQRFVSIRWARNPQYALADENGTLRFSRVTNQQGTTPPEKFLFERKFPSVYYQAFQTKSCKRFIRFDVNNCSVNLTSRNPINIRNHYFNVNCKPNVNRCFCS